VTWVQKIFEGVLINEIQCRHCGNVSHREENFVDLSLDIEDCTSITHCLRQFSKSELLAGQEKYMCDNCHCRQEAFKSMKIRSLPQVLVLHMKRFKYMDRIGSFKKLYSRVVFPFELRIVDTVQLCDPVDENRIYDLFAVVIHIGGGVRSGHYVCMVRHHRKWFLYDDDLIRCISEDDVRSCFGSTHSNVHRDGYLLFYETRNASLERGT